MRARMIELSWSGLRVPAIAVELGCSQKTVRCWLHRFNDAGLQGPDDLGGQGRKRRITEEERSRVRGAPEVKLMILARRRTLPRQGLNHGEAGLAHEPFDTLAADVDALTLEDGVHARRAVDPAGIGVDLPDQACQLGVLAVPLA